MNIFPEVNFNLSTKKATGQMKSAVALEAVSCYLCDGALLVCQPSLTPATWESSNTHGCDLC